MIFPRTRRQGVKYGRHKALAAAVTFVVVWAFLHLTGLDDRIRDRFRPSSRLVTPEEAFRDRWSQVETFGEGVVESATDASAPGDVAVRTASGHPLILRGDLAHAEGIAAGDSVRFRGVYIWDSRGGVIDASEGEFARIGSPGAAPTP